MSCVRCARTFLCIFELRCGSSTARRLAQGRAPGAGRSTCYSPHHTARSQAPAKRQAAHSAPQPRPSHCCRCAHCHLAPPPHAPRRCSLQPRAAALLPRRCPAYRATASATIPSNRHSACAARSRASRVGGGGTNLPDQRSSLPRDVAPRAAPCSATRTPLLRALGKCPRCSTYATSPNP
eukprot:scaffold4204_cov140-Isochrysis_galbana.AAC.4